LSGCAASAPAGKNPPRIPHLKKLCRRRLPRNRDTPVTAPVKREQAQRCESEALPQKAFDGFLPAFPATFLRGRRLTEKEAAEIRLIIEEAKKE
jgi:predicted transcriptional regulator